jgi:hypothetical protein
MRLAESQFDPESLGELCAEALQLLASGNIDALAERFGYAFAYACGGDPVLAIQADLASSLASVGATSLAQADARVPKVGYYAPNSTGLLALIEGRAPTNNGKTILVELVVTGSGDDKHITLEQISDADSAL